jgi:hypothetical protein
MEQASSNKEKDGRCLNGHGQSLGSQLQDLALVTRQDGVASGRPLAGGDDAVIVTRHSHHRAAVVIISAIFEVVGSVKLLPDGRLAFWATQDRPPPS